MLRILIVACMLASCGGHKNNDSQGTTVINQQEKDTQK